MANSTITLGQIASARSGDKGNHGNIGVVAYTPAGYAWLVESLTPELMAEYFQSLGVTAVERYELPKVGALNFILRDVLGGGASQSLRIDTQGKLLGTAVMDLELPRPANLPALLPAAPGI
jgi:hypothetical protein